MSNYAASASLAADHRRNLMNAAVDHRQAKIARPSFVRRIRLNRP